MKHYHNHDAVRLIDEVERQGGELLAETCMSDEIEDLHLPNKPAMSTGCEEEALFLVAYDPSATVTVNEPILIPDDDPNAPDGRRKAKLDDNGQVLYHAVEHAADGGGIGELSTVRVCANDDLMREWPRFRHVIQRPDPTRRG